MCSRKKKIRENLVPTLKNMNLNDFTHIIDTMRPARISISGQGEPTLNPQLIEIIKYAQMNKTDVTMISNFILPEEQYLEGLVKSKLKLLKVSLDAANKETYRKIRGSAEFPKIINNIQILNMLKKKHKSKTPFIRLQFCMQQYNYKELLDFILLANDLEVDAIYFQPLELTYFEEKKNILIGGITPEDLFQEIHKAAKKADSLKISSNIRELSNNFHLYRKKYKWDHKNNSEKQKPPVCLMPWFTTYITVDGAIKPCGNFSRVAMDFGNMFKTPLHEIWNSESYRTFRRTMKNHDYEYEMCKDCVAKDSSYIRKMHHIIPDFLKRNKTSSTS